MKKKNPPGKTNKEQIPTSFIFVKLSGRNFPEILGAYLFGYVLTYYEGAPLRSYVVHVTNT